MSCGAIVEWFRDRARDNPPAHHVTNIAVDETADPAGRVDVRPLVSERYDLSEGVRALERAQTKGVLKVLIERVGVDRLVLGSDYPVGEKDPVGWLRDDCGLRGADLRGANLGEAHLSGADLRCADLRGADLRGAWLLDECATYRTVGERFLWAATNLQGARYDRHTRWLAGFRPQEHGARPVE